MGDDPDSSVVDEFCRSHDIPNLYVCDTSVFVTGSGVNPTLTAMAIARRAVKHIVMNGSSHERLSSGRVAC
jgi:choline dehydrogenase-like flavoprotein